MLYRLLADLLVLLHFGFILFVLFGGLLVLWRRWLILLHLSAAAWGALIEFAGWICPLTPWEIALRVKAGQTGYGGGFIEHYLVSLIYPAGLTPQVQIAFGVIVLIVNVAIYSYVASRLRPTVRVFHSTKARSPSASKTGH